MLTPEQQVVAERLITKINSNKRAIEKILEDLNKAKATFYHQGNFTACILTWNPSGIVVGMTKRHCPEKRHVKLVTKELVVSRKGNIYYVGDEEDNPALGEQIAFARAVKNYLGI